MSLVTKYRFAKLSGVSQQAVTSAVKRGEVLSTKGGKIDLSDAKNVMYLKKEKSKKAYSPKTIQPTEDDILNPEDISNASKDDLIKLKYAHQIEDIRFNREIKRREYIERSFLEAILSKKYEIDRSAYLPMKDKLMPDLSSIFGVTDEKKITLARERLDAELYRTLDYTKATFDEFLSGLDYDKD